MKPAVIESGTVTTLTRSISGCASDPVSLYGRLCAEGSAPATALLESADQTTKSGEKSLVMVRAALAITGHGRRIEIRALSPNGAPLLTQLANIVPEEVSVTHSDAKLQLDYPPRADGEEQARLNSPGPLDALRQLLAQLRPTVTSQDHPALLIGSLGYDLVAAYEDLPDARADHSGWPDIEMWLADRVVWIDHAARRTTAVCYVVGGERSEQRYHDGAHALAALVASCESTESQDAYAVSAADHPTPQVDMDDEAYMAQVAELKQHIIDGEVFQIVPSRTFSLPCSEPLAAYTRLRALNPSPYMFFLSGSQGILFGASPESALTVTKDGAGGQKRVTISPIAGTRPRGRREDGTIDHDLDTRLEAELRLDEKEVAEHIMLVDLARNDVARISEAGTREVSKLLEVVRYSHVMHLVSLVSGRLRSNLDALHAYAATMNMGTLVGAPKIRAATLLRQREATRRGPYGGAVGYLTADGEFDSCIVIRSAQVSHGVAQVRAGAGVVFDSDPRAEADETRRKAAAVLQALEER